jgi:hypothetical protein
MTLNSPILLPFDNLIFVDISEILNMVHISVLMTLMTARLKNIFVTENQKVRTSEDKNVHDDRLPAILQI